MGSVLLFGAGFTMVFNFQIGETLHPTPMARFDKCAKLDKVWCMALGLEALVEAEAAASTVPPGLASSSSSSSSKGEPISASCILTERILLSMQAGWLCLFGRGGGLSSRPGGRWGLSPSPVGAVVVHAIWGGVCLAS